LAAISNFEKYRNYWFFDQSAMKSCIAGKFDSRFEKFMSFYVKKLSLEKKRGGVCLRKVALKVVQFLFLQLQRVLSESELKSNFLYMKMKPKESAISSFSKF
jgi:phage terminase large subunit